MKKDIHLLLASLSLPFLVIPSNIVLFTYNDKGVSRWFRCRKK